MKEGFRILACIIVSPFIALMAIFGAVLGFIDFAVTGKTDWWKEWFTHYLNIGGKR